MRESGEKVQKAAELKAAPVKFIDLLKVCTDKGLYMLRTRENYKKKPRSYGIRRDKMGRNKKL